MLIGKMISLKGRKLVVNLVVMDMPNFDIILNMDFLSRNGVKIDYGKYKVWFSLDMIDKIVLDVKNTLVVQVFLDVFSDSLPRLLLERQVKFNIELTLGTTLI